MSRWGDEKTLHFIYLYRLRECLWNTRSPFYKNKLAREQAYQSILKTFNDKHLDIRSVKTKIKNLRSVYHTELKKIKHVARYGSDGQVYKPSLSWFDEMHAFLGDSTEDRLDSTGEAVSNEVEPQTENNIVIPIQDTTVEVEHMTIEGALENSKVPLQDIQTVTDNDSNNYSLSKTTASVTNHSPVQTQNQRIVNRRKRPHESVLTAIQRLEHTVSSVVNSTQPQPPQSQNEDEFHMFALSVAAQLRQLPLHIAIATQSKIQGTLSEARLASIFSNTLSPPTITVKSEDVSD